MPRKRSTPEAAFNPTPSRISALQPTTSYPNRVHAQAPGTRHQDHAPRGRKRKSKSGAPRNVRARRLEAEAQEVFGPALWGSNHIWDLMGYWAGIHHVFGPLRKRIQTLARKYRHDPGSFKREAQRVTESHVKELAKNPIGQWILKLVGSYLSRLATRLGNAPSGSTQDRLTLPEDLSAKQAEAFAQLLPLTRRAAKGLPVKTSPKRLLKFLGAFAAERPGPRPDAIARRIRKIYREARARGQHLTDGQIATRVFGKNYTTANSSRKRQYREWVRSKRRHPSRRQSTGKSSGNK